MTVSTTIPTISYEYTGPGRYDFDFLTYEETDLTVIYTSEEGVATELVLETDYTVELSDTQDGGYIETTNPTDTDGTLSIDRILPVEQSVDWVNNDPLDAEILERSFDRIVMILQQQDPSIVTTGLRWTGDWVANSQYQNLNICSYLNDIYISNGNFTSGSTFNLLNWSILIDLSDLYTAMAGASDDAADASISEANAAVSAQDAANCSYSAYDSGIAAAGSATAANNWAQYPEDQPVPEGTGAEYSSYHWSKKAELVAGGGLTDLNVVAPITADKSNPNIPIIGFDPAGLDLTEQYLGQGVAFQLTAANDLNNITQPGLYTWESGKPTNSPGAYCTMIVSVTGQGFVKQFVYQATGRVWIRLRDLSPSWQVWAEVGPDPYVNEYAAINAATLSQVDIDASLYDTIYVYGFDQNTQLNINNMTDGRTIAISLDTVGLNTITANIPLLWPDGDSPQYSETGINVITITNFGGGRYIANLSQNHK